MYFKTGVLGGLFLFTAFISFNSAIHTTVRRKPINDDDGKILFNRYCAMCHMLPQPKSLTRNIWAQHVLPIMASRMGIIYPNYDPLKGLSAGERAVVKKNYIIPDEPIIRQEDWDKIADYIIKNAPDSVSIDQARLTRNSPLTQFTRKDIDIAAKSPSLITGLKYNQGTKTLWIADFYNELFTWQYKNGVTKTLKTESPVVDFNFYKADTYLTEIGRLYPTELDSGSYVRVTNIGQQTLLSSLHRPVHTKINDLNNDGTPEIVSCNFGNKTGSLSLFVQNKSGKYKEQVLLPLSGAIKCYIRDMNGDGKKDIVAMFSQGDESVYIFYQKDNLKFRAQRVLRFPPNYGTTDMILVDYNHDGLTDIVTVHGDNADYSNQPKAYHGIRININAGNDTYKQRFFYPIYGVTRVLADDFDKDGDIDFVATSFFPDFGKLVDESFIYLENKDQAKFIFKPYTLKSDVPIKTLTLEKADIDGDGDMDIITGNFAQSPGRVPDDLNEKWKNAKYGITVFFNTLQ
jgi:hypothetical protein